MSATNHTSNLQLPQYIGTDKPTYLGDWNETMSKIDNFAGQTEDHLGESDSTLSQLRNSVSHLQSEITTQESMIDAVNSAITSIEERQTSQQTNINKLNTDTTQALEDIDAIHTKDDTQDGQIELLGQNTASLLTRVSTNETNIQLLSKGLKKIATLQTFISIRNIGNFTSGDRSFNILTARTYLKSTYQELKERALRYVNNVIPRSLSVRKHSGYGNVLANTSDSTVYHPINFYMITPDGGYYANETYMCEIIIYTMLTMIANDETSKEVKLFDSGTMFTRTAENPNGINCTDYTLSSDFNITLSRTSVEQHDFSISVNSGSVIPEIMPNWVSAEYREECFFNV